MIFKEAFFPILIVICWVHVCSGDIPDKPTTTNSSIIATPTLRSDNDDRCKSTIQPENTSLPKEQHTENDIIKNDLDNDVLTIEQQNLLARRRYTRFCKKRLDPLTGEQRLDLPTSEPDIQNSFGKLLPSEKYQISKAEYNDIIKEQPQGYVPMKMKNVNDTDFWSEYNGMTTKQKNELARNFYKRMILEKGGSTKNEDIEAGFNKLWEVPILHRFIKIYAEQEYQRLNTEPHTENDKNINDPEFDAMKNDLHVELAKRRYKRYCYNKSDPITDCLDSPQTSNEMEIFFEYLWPEFRKDMTKAEYNDIKKEQSPKKMSNKNNKTDPRILEKFYKMSVSEIMETARQRYISKRREMICPFTDIKYDFGINTDQKINDDFNILTPFYIILLVKLELDIKL